MMKKQLKEKHLFFPKLINFGTDLSQKFDFLSFSFCKKVILLTLNWFNEKNNQIE
jgi:hypothetical protein